MEIEAIRRELDAVPDGAEKREMLSAVAEMQRNMANMDRLDSAVESHDRAEALKLKRGGMISAGLGLGLAIVAVSMVAVAISTGGARATDRVFMVSVFAALIGLVLLVSGVFVLKKRRSVRNLFSRREWQAVSVVEALKERSQPRICDPPPIWRNKGSDHRIVGRVSDYETSVIPLICELIATIPQAWSTCEVAVDCDGISIRCQIRGDGDEIKRIEPSSALLHFCAGLYARMGMTGNKWSACTISCKRNRQTWSFETEFVYTGSFPTEGHVTPRSLSDQELEGLISYFEHKDARVSSKVRI